LVNIFVEEFFISITICL